MLINKVNKVGHIFLNSSFNYIGDSLRINTLTQKRINISKPGCTDSVFLITSDIFSIKFYNFLVYLSLSPLKMTKHILSNDIILFLFSSLSLLKNDD